MPLAAEGSSVRPGDKINSPQQLVDDHVDGIAEEGDPSLSGSVASGRVGTAGGRVSVGTVHACFLLRKQNREIYRKVTTSGCWFLVRPLKHVISSSKNQKFRHEPASLL